MSSAANDETPAGDSWGFLLPARADFLLANGHVLLLLQEG